MNSLPRELIIDIFYATAPENRWALVCTCRGFYQLLNHLLYREVELYIPLECPRDSFSPFFTAVQQNSDLANSVRELKLSGPRPDSVWIEKSDESCGGLWIGEEWLTGYLHYEGGKQEERNGKTLYLHSWDTGAIVALLIIRLKNLQSLKLGYEFWYNDPYLNRIFMTKEVLKNPKEVFLDPDPPDFGAGIMQQTRGWVRSINTDQLARLLQLPSIETISCSIWQDRTENDYYELLCALEPIYLYNNIRCLRLPRSSLHHAILKRILTVSPKLREFDYHQLIELDLNGENTPISCEDMDTALEPIRNILEELTLGVHCQTWRNSDLRPDVRGVMRSLAGFTQLIQLNIYYLYLLNPNSQEPTQLVKLLPLTLRVLRVLGTNSSDYDAYGEQRIDYKLLYYRLRQYVNKKATHAPYLQSLDVIVGNDFDEQPALKNAYTRLQKACLWARIVLNACQIW